MALGVPVVASDISGNREIVKTDVTGLLVPPGEPPRLAEAILTMLNYPSRARSMAENAKRLVQQFTIQNAAARYAQIYRQAAIDLPHRKRKHR
jgi:glycosyltransferase involved in cell wall biosynthesis